MKQMPKTAIAFDCNISNEIIGQYARQGYVIVTVALDGEDDFVWIKRAYDFGAEFIVSADFDVPKIIAKNFPAMKWAR